MTSARPPQLQIFPAEGTLDDVLGFQMVEASGDRCLARFAVEPRVQQPFGLVHGGAYAALAETMVSWATSVAVAPEGKVAVGQSNSTTFLRAVTSGHVQAEGTPRLRGRTTWVWDVELTDDECRACALSRVTLAVRPAPPPAHPASDAGGSKRSP
jgi:1,4-dihydroxy-2-naphthoyl-CoA hydrolase